MCNTYFPIQKGVKSKCIKHWYHSMFSTSQVRDFEMKLLITSLIFTLAAAKIVFKTPEEEARFDAGKWEIIVISFYKRIDMNCWFVFFLCEYYQKIPLPTNFPSHDFSVKCIKHLSLLITILIKFINYNLKLGWEVENH